MSLITKINTVENVALVTFGDVPSDIDFLSEVFCGVADRKINVDMISKTANTGNTINLSFTVDDGNIRDILEISNMIKKKYPGIKTLIQGNNAKIVLFGESFPDECGVAASAFKILSGVNIDVIMVVTSDMDISILISGTELTPALEALNGAYFETV